jgi:hypothetical protein
VVPPPAPPAHLVLRNIAAAWRQRADDLRRHYQQEVFFEGTPPRCAASGVARDVANRREWMHLFMLGAMHTIGLAHPAEHREFMRLCHREGWLDVFADPDIDPSRWLEVLDRYLDPAVREAKYYRGMQRFISFYQFARHLADYARSFLDMNAMGGMFTLSQVLRSRENHFQSGGGIDVPPLTNALGIGACFVVRELVRARLITNPAAHRYCYVPVRRVRLLLTGLGCGGLMSTAEDRWERSRQIHSFLSQHLSDAARGDDPTFGGDFDLPLLAAADGELGAYGLPEETEAFIQQGMQDFAD